jgi:hypothetical protein
MSQFYLLNKAIRRDDLFNNEPKLAQFRKMGYICSRPFVEGHTVAHILKDNIDWLVAAASSLCSSKAPLSFSIWKYCTTSARNGSMVLSWGLCEIQHLLTFSLQDFSKQEYSTQLVGQLMKAEFIEHGLIQIEIKV